MLFVDFFPIPSPMLSLSQFHLLFFIIHKVLIYEDEIMKLRTIDENKGWHKIWNFFFYTSFS
jgi:hypothetical protein